MSTPRLTFLYPILFRPIQTVENASLRTARRRLRPHEAGFSTTPRRRQEVRPERYTTPSDPPLHIDAEARRPIAPREATPAAKREQQPAQVESAKDARPPPPPPPKADTKRPDANPPPSPLSTFTPPGKAELGASSEATSSDASQTVPEWARTRGGETVLEMPSLSEETREEEKPPHLDTPRYVHHFDTWSLVRDLEGGGLSQDQSVTIMKAVRGILADNMELARRALVTKSNVENETYLFRAACSELRTEIQNNRKTATEKMRTERTQLQHEVDILNQRMTQETSNMKDELKGMFDDRKMAVRMEQKKMESKIQELNYKITVALNSDARSEVEGLRWILTRRAAAAIIIAALMVLGALRYSVYMSQMQKQDREAMKGKGKKEQVSIATQTEGGDVGLGRGLDSGIAGLSRAEGVPEEGLLVSEGGVSLG